MLVLLPPSETKHAGGSGPPLDLAVLTAADELTGVRAQLVDALVALADDVPASRTALQLSPAQDDEVARNAALRTAPTLPAIQRYTGVLYDALDVGTLTTVQRARADARLAVGSALFGVVRAGDPIPAYRLSAHAHLPGLPNLRMVWKPVLPPVLAATEGLVVDLRSGSYQALAPVPGAVTVDVVSERADGSRAVVSHFNKAHKGRVARLLVTSRAEPGDATALVALLRRGGFHVERGRGARALTLVVPA